MNISSPSEIKELRALLSTTACQTHDAADLPINANPNPKISHSIRGDLDRPGNRPIPSQSKDQERVQHSSQQLIDRRDVETCRVLVRLQRLFAKNRRADLIFDRFDRAAIIALYAWGAMTGSVVARCICDSGQTIFVRYGEYTSSRHHMPVVHTSTCPPNGDQD